MKIGKILIILIIILLGAPCSPMQEPGPTPAKLKSICQVIVEVRVEKQKRKGETYSVPSNHP